MERVNGLKTVLDAARELLIDLERHEVTLDDGELAAEEPPRLETPSTVPAKASGAGAASHSEGTSEAKDVLLTQLDRMKERCAHALAVVGGGVPFAS